MLWGLFLLCKINSLIKNFFFLKKKHIPELTGLHNKLYTQQK